MSRHRLVCWLLIALCCGVARAAEPASSGRPVLVVGARSPVKALTAEQVQALFLGQIVEWREGQRLTPLDYDDAGSLQQDFYQAHLGRSLNRMRAYWSRIVFAQEGRPPALVRSEEEIRSYLEGQPLAVGYVPAEAVPQGLRIVAR